MTTRPKAKDKTKLPSFASEAEAAEFWDTHSPEEFPGQFQEVDARLPTAIGKRGLTVRLAGETLAELRALAKDKGVGPSTLVRMWVLERLKNVRRQAG